MTEIADLWGYLSRDPLAAYAATICAWWLVLQLPGQDPRSSARQSRVLLAVVLLAGTLPAAGINYRAYFEGGSSYISCSGRQPSSLPCRWRGKGGRCARTRARSSSQWPRESATAVLSGVGLALAFGGGELLAATLVPRVTTAPVAMKIAEGLGGLSGLADIVAYSATGATLGPATWRAPGRPAPRAGRTNQEKTRWSIQPSQMLLPSPSASTRFIPSLQSPVLIRGSPWRPAPRLRSMARAQCADRGSLTPESSGRKNRSDSPGSKDGPCR